MRFAFLSPIFCIAFLNSGAINESEKCEPAAGEVSYPAIGLIRGPPYLTRKRLLDILQVPEQLHSYVLLDGSILKNDSLVQFNTMRSRSFFIAIRSWL